MRATDKASYAAKVRRRTAAQRDAARHTNPLQRRRCTLVVPVPPPPDVELLPYQRAFLDEIRRPQPARSRVPSFFGVELLALAGALFRGARTRRTRDQEAERLRRHREALRRPIHF